MLLSEHYDTAIYKDKSRKGNYFTYKDLNKVIEKIYTFLFWYVRIGL